MPKQPKKKVSAPPPSSSDGGRTSGKPYKKRPKVFDAVKRRLVTKKS